MRPFFQSGILNKLRNNINAKEIKIIFLFLIQTRWEDIAECKSKTSPLTKLQDSIDSSYTVLVSMSSLFFHNLTVR